MERDIAAILSNPAALRQMLEETQQVVQQSQPTIPIPERDVPQDVILHGQVTFIARFPWSSIAGLDERTIYQRVDDVLHGAAGHWLPQVELGQIVLWRERKIDVESGEQPQPRSNVVGTSQPHPGGIPGLRDSHHESDDGDTDLRGTDGREVWYPDTEG